VCDRLPDVSGTEADDVHVEFALQHLGQKVSAAHAVAGKLRGQNRDHFARHHERHCAVIESKAAFAEFDAPAAFAR
jgi:hypothetical protein